MKKESKIIKTKVNSESRSFLTGIIIGFFVMLLVGILFYTVFPKMVISLYDNNYSREEMVCSCLPNHCSHFKQQLVNSIPDSDVKEYEKTGPIGDTFGGTIGPAVALLAAFLTFIAFYIQYLANKQQRKDIERERFENKFFELLKIQREIVNEMRVGKIKNGSPCFVSFFYEFRYTYLCVEECLLIDPIQPSEDIKRAGLDKQEVILQIAYTIFFMGIGPNSDILVKETLNKFGYNQFTDLIINHLKTKIQTGTNGVISKHKFPGTSLEVQVTDSRIGTVTYKPNYRPFQGHQGKLGHYYRNLYQLIKFIDGADENILPSERKIEFAKIIRSQISVYEQILLYYNSFASFGRPWVNEELLVKYKLIKNMPLPLLKFSIDPKAYLGSQIEKIWGKEVPFFEWDESKIESLNI